MAHHFGKLDAKTSKKLQKYNSSASVSRKKLPNVYESYLKMISLEK